MEFVKIFCQLIIALGIFNVWLIRFNKPTEWRGAGAKDMRSEFAAYGLTETTMYLVGGLKILFAIGLLIGIWVPTVADISAVGIAALMAGAVAMHQRVGDKLIKSLPAATLLVLSLLVFLA